MAGDGLNFGRAIAYQGTPTLAIQIAREREARNAAIAERAQARDAADRARKDKAAKDAFDVSLSEISIKDPSKYHRLYLPEAMEDKRQLTNRMAQVWATDRMNAANSLRDEVSAYQMRQAQRQAESLKWFGVDKSAQDKIFVDPEIRRISATGNINDAYAYAKAKGIVTGTTVAEDPQTGVTQFGFDLVPDQDIDEPFRNFQKNEKNYTSKLGTVRPDGTGYGTQRESFTFTPQSKQALKAALLQDKGYLNNLIRKEASTNEGYEKMLKEGFDPNNPDTMTAWAAGKIDEKIKEYDQPRYVENRVNVQEPTQTEKEKTTSTWGDGNWQGSEYKVQSLKLPDGRYRTTVNPVKGAAEGLKLTTWADAKGDPIYGRLAYVDHLSNGSVDKLVIWQYDDSSKQKMEEIGYRYAQLAQNNTDKKLSTEQNTAYLKEIGEVAAKAKTTKKTLPPVNTNLDLINGVYLEGKTNLNEYSKRALPKSAQGQWIDPKTEKKIPLSTSSANKAKTITSEAEYNSLKPGDQYIWNGQTHTKE